MSQVGTKRPPGNSGEGGTVSAEPRIPLIFPAINFIDIFPARITDCRWSDWGGGEGEGDLLTEAFQVCSRDLVQPRDVIDLATLVPLGHLLHPPVPHRTEP